MQPPETQCKNAALPPSIWRLAAGVVVFLAAGVNAAGLGAMLYYGRLHVVKYYVYWPMSDGQFVRWALIPGVLAVAMYAVFWGWGLMRVRQSGQRFNATMWSKLSFSWWPMALALSWAIPWTEASPPSFHRGFFLYIAILLLAGWSVGRFVRSVSQLCPDAIQLTLNSPTDTPKAGLISWWREKAFGVVVVLSAGLMIYTIYTQQLLWKNLQYGSPDIGLYAEMLQNVLRGQGLYCEAFGHSFWGEHVSPGLYLLVPLYAIYPHIQTLMIIGSVAVLSGAWAVYALVRVMGGSARTACVLAIAFLLHPSTSRVIFGASYGFHEILVALPLMLWSFYFFVQRRWFWMALLMVLAISFKENVAIVYGAFGLMHVWPLEKRRWGLLLFVLCLAHFLIAVKLIVPHFNTAQAYSKFYLFKELGGTPDGMLQTLWENPGKVLGRMFDFRSLGYVLALFGPVGFATWRKPVWLAALPSLLFICLMDTRDFASIRFWHQASILPVIWLATAWAVTQWSHASVAINPTLQSLRAGRCAMAITNCTLFGIVLGFTPFSHTHEVMFSHLSKNAEHFRSLQQAVEHIEAMVPPQATVQASPRLAAHFIDRRRVYPLERGLEPQPEWIIVDVQESFIGSMTTREMFEYAQQVEADPDYQLTWRWESIFVFTRIDADSQQHIERN